VLLALLAVLVLVSGFYFAGRSGSDPLVYSNDFNVFYHAASEVLAGRDPYQSSLAGWTPYLYPPLLAVSLTSLAAVPLPVAAYVWFLTNAVSAISAAWMSGKLAYDGVQPGGSGENPRYVPGLRGLLLPPMIAVCAVAIVARFVLDNFSLGQVNPLIAALVAAHIYLYSKNRKTASAVILAIAVSIKLTPIVLLGYHIARRRWKFSALSLGLALAVFALSFLPFGAQAPEALRIFVSRTIQNQQGYDLAYAGNQSLRGAIARLTPATSRTQDHAVSESSRRPSDPVTLAIALALLAAAMVTAHRARSEVAAAAPFVCCLVLLSPLSWKAHFVVLILPIATLIAAAVRSRKIQCKILIAVLAVVFVLFNLTSPAVVGLRAAEWADAHSLVFLGALLIFGTSVWAARFAREG
jgi:alpha-1,2-mannosyltransferase